MYMCLYVSVYSMFLALPSEGLQHCSLTSPRSGGFPGKCEKLEKDLRGMSKAAGSWAV